ncbi:ABC transporter substrate-binding protein [Marinobacter salinexigens]|uniref:ABC transporter substrate-binding protein n=1 Tax=Marinobacter salinexigens TaxID=2919747 RepID=A0A5B0VHX4_9GAMM|nr:ABC transporter substrate-binding protein [Marinobacter salinexigens]
MASDGSVRTVYIAGSGNTGLDQHLTQLLKAQFDEHIVLLPVSDDRLPAIQDAPVIAIGPSAFTRVWQANRKIPILAMLVEKDLVQSYAERSPGQISAVLYDVPLLRQALTGKSILPQATKIALMATSSSAKLYDPLIEQLPDYGLEARLFLVDGNDDLIPTLVRALGYGDFLLAASDDLIYNPRTIKHILLTSYRRNRIVIGPSQAYVKAGSLASSYAPFPVMANLAARFINTYFSDGKLPAPSYPESYKVEVNKQVARSLNIPLPDRDEIAETVNVRLGDHGGAEHE